MFHNRNINKKKGKKQGKYIQWILADLLFQFSSETSFEMPLEMSL